MANTKSAAKYALTSKRRHDENASVITGIKTEQKKLRAAVASGDKAAAQAGLKTITAALDKAAKRGVIHANAADRRKSRFNKLVANAA